MLVTDKMLSDERNRHDFAIAVTAAFISKGIDRPTPQQIDAAVQIYAEIINHLSNNSFIAE